MTITIRRAEVADAAAIAGIAARTFPLGCPAGTPQADLDAFIQKELTPARFETYIAGPRSEVFAAIADGSLAGFSMLCKSSAPPDSGAGAIHWQNPLELRKIYVLPEYHGSGAGRALMAAAFGRAEELRAGGIWLSVSRFNERAIAFYRKHGFTTAGETTFLVGNDIQEDYLMTRAI